MKLTTPKTTLALLILLSLIIMPFTAYGKPVQPDSLQKSLENQRFQNSGQGGFDEYGYHEKARIFSGTFDNWEALMYGEPPLPAVSPGETDVIFLVRRWDKAFDNGMFKNEPLKDGSWCASYFYENLSGEQLGWTWHWYFYYTYSSQPIEGGLPIPDMPGFYYTVDREWLVAPDGTEVVTSEFYADSFYNKTSSHLWEKINNSRLPQVLFKTK